MSDRTDLVYYYDGSFNGFLCCIFDCYDRREDPTLILPQDSDQGVLFESHTVETSGEKAGRVLRSIPKKIGPEALEILHLGFLAALPDRELLLLRFVRQGLSQGPALLRRITQEPLCTLLQTVQAVKHEAHLFTGFVRFSDHGGALTAVITPKHNVLPVMAEHFCSRFSGERFLIYDKAHKLALVHEPGRAEIIPLELQELPGPTDEERHVRALWRQFYKTIAIEERHNPRCRMSHMPKHFWQDMTEFQSDPPAGPLPVSAGAPELPLAVE